jgi:hypothetical protein
LEYVSNFALARRQQAVSGLCKITDVRLLDIIRNNFSHAKAQRSQRNVMFLYLGFAFKPFALLGPAWRQTGWREMPYCR